MKQTSPLDFLKQTQEDPALNERVLKAVETGNNMTAEEVMRLAREAGYTFSQSEFEEAVKRNIAERFAAGESQLAELVNAKRPPMSSCARGCVSWTVNWHPKPELIER